MKAKTIYHSLFLMGAIFLFTSVTAYGQKIEKLTALYQGITEEYQFEFIDDKNKSVLFTELADDVEIDLYDEELKGTKFKITWEEDSYEIYDDEGEPTGTFEKFTRILSLEVTN